MAYTRNPYVERIRYWQGERLSIAEKAAAKEIAEHCDESGRCFPGLQRIADLIGASSTRYVQNLVNELERKRVFSVERKRGRGGLIFEFPLLEDTECEGESKNNGSAFGKEKARTIVPHSDESQNNSSAFPSVENLNYSSEITEKAGTNQQESRNYSSTEDTSKTLKNKNKKRESIPHSVGTRIPADFCLSEKMSDWATTNYPAISRTIETEKFKDYWLSADGRNAVKRDWEAAWRNWIRRSSEYQLKEEARPKPQSVSDRNVERLVKTRTLADAIGRGEMNDALEAIFHDMDVSRLAGQQLQLTAGD